jgi:Leucine-rich repeat (LRR) protein
MKTKLLIVFAFCTFNLFSQTNLALNGGFETWTNSTTLSNWTIENSVTQNTTNYTEGSKSAQLSIANSALPPKIIAQVPMTAGKTYTVKFKYKYVTNNYSGQHPISLNISKNGSATTLSNSIFASDNNWTVKETTFTPDQNMSYDLSISLFTFDAAAFNVLIDDVQVYIQGTEQYTLIPDVNFEKKLIALGIDSGTTDGKVLTNSVNKLTSLNVSSITISDLTGIQDFVNLKTLKCAGNSSSTNGGDGKLTKLDVTKNVLLTSLECTANQIPNLDLSQNTLLTTLNCQGNKLTSLDVSKNLALKELTCGFNQLTNLDVAKNVDLTSLNCNYNQLTAIDISKNVALTFLGCDYNQFTNINISKNVNLINFWCSYNKLTTLDVTKNLALMYLYCQSNQLTTLDISNNLALKHLYSFSNQLTTLDVSKNENLIAFFCNSNKLLGLNLKNGKNTSLNNNSVDFTGNPYLSCIAVDDVNYSNTNWVNKKENTAFFSAYTCNTITQIPDDKFEDKLIALGIDTDGKNGLILNSSITAITSLDLSNSSISNLKGIQGFTALTTLNCSGNILKKLDLSKNTTFSTLNCSNNPSLICIQVADIAYATANWTAIKDAIASYSLDCTAYTLIPDPMFEDKLIALGIDQDGKNGKVATESIAAIISLNVYSSSIVDLTGIQDFSALTNLECSSNRLTNLDISKNLALKTLRTEYTNYKTLDVSKNLAMISLFCTGNQLTNLDVSKNLALTNLSCSSNQLKTLDVSNNLALGYLFCSDNQLTAIDISKNLSLTKLDYSSNQIPSLDISKHLSLTYLKCERNQIKDLDVSKNIALEYLHCKNNNLKTIDVSKNTSLLNLYCDVNQLTSLDVSSNKVLAYFTCTYNNLFNLNIKNGNNINFYPSDTYTNFTKNPNLSCIQVDDVTYSNTNWTSKKDVTASFSNACAFVIPYTLIPDPNFEDKLITLGIDTDGKNGKVTTANVASLTTLEVSNSNIASLTGIEDFVSLTYLDCSTNVITTLDVSKNTDLADLNCNANKLTSLDVSKNLVLNKLKSSENSLTTLDVSKNTFLTEINCYKNSLTALNLKNGNNVNMKRMNFANLAQNPNLQCIQVDNAAFCNSNWDAKDTTAGYSSDCTPLANTYTTIPDAKFEDKLIALGIDKDGKNGKVLTASIFNVSTLDVSNSAITDLTGIQDFRMITSLTCGNNAITALDVSKNLNLDKLYCSVNKISNLSLTKNTAIRVLSCSFNLLTTLNVTANKSLKELECSNNNLTYLNIQNGNNANMQNMIFGNFTNNPKLTCILIDDEAYSNANWAISKDKIASYNTVCVPYTIIPDSNFEDKLIALGMDTDGKNGKVKTSSINTQVDLDISSSSIADMTGIQDFTTLKKLNCSGNLLTNLDVSKNTALIDLECSSNKLTTLDLSKNTTLIGLGCSSNQLKTLDVSKNTQLQSLSISQNLLELLNVTNNTKLESILCSNNALKTLDISKNVKITTIDCSYNKLKSLNLRNGNNAFGAGMMFVKNFTNNPDLTCIEVDDVTYSDTNWKYYKDVTANYNVGCYTLIPDAKFEDKLIALGIDKDGKNGKVATESIAIVTSLSVNSSSISNLTGIQDFAALQTLVCYSNQLTNLDVSKNAALAHLECDSNQLTNLDVSKNVALTFFECQNNQLTTLDVSKNTALTYFDCSYNKLTVLDFSKNTALTGLKCYANKLQTLNLKNGKNTLLTNSNISLSGNTNLYCILVDDVTYSTTNWANRKDATATFNSVECKPLSLPANNFTVESKGETCTDSKNGEINISATAAYTYKANINGTSYSFTNNSLKVPNLVPGTYTVSITITGETFEQSFTIVIPKAATITGKSSVTANKVSVEITQGTAPYTVFVDGVEQFETTESSFSVATKKGGVLEVKTAKACEGIYAATIAGLEGAVTAYPNPTSGSFEVQLPTSKKEVIIALYTLNGQLISNKTYTVENGKAQLTLENQPTGVYIAKIEFDTPDYLKIIKN